MSSTHKKRRRQEEAEKPRLETPAWRDEESDSDSDRTSEGSSDSDNDASTTGRSKHNGVANGKQNGHTAAASSAGNGRKQQVEDDEDDDESSEDDSSDDDSDDEHNASDSHDDHEHINGRTNGSASPSSVAASSTSPSASANKTSTTNRDLAKDLEAESSDSDNSSVVSSDEESEGAAAGDLSQPRVSSLTAGQHEDESDDEFAFMRIDAPYPPMDFQNKSRCQRFIKKTATNIKRVFMKKIVRRMRVIRKRYRADGRSTTEAEADPGFVALHAEYKLLEKYNIALLCELSWAFYWYKHKAVRFPKELELTQQHKYYISAGLQHTMMRLAFQQIIKAHLHKLKRQARKIIKAVNRQERKDEKYIKQNKVKELTDLLAEGRMPVKAQNVDQLKVGQVVDAIVDGVTATGVYVVFWRASEQIRGMIHVSELSDAYTADPAALFHVGDKLNPVLINVDAVHHKVSLSMKPVYYIAPAVPRVEHIAVHMREAALAERDARHAAKAATLVPVGLSSVFLDRIRSQIGLDDASVEKIKQFYALAAGHKVSKNRLGQKARRRLAEEVLGWQRKLRRNERPPTKKQLKKARRKEEENLRRGILPLTEEEKEAKRQWELAEKKARALRKYDKNKERNKLRKAEERRKREEKEAREKEERIKAKIRQAQGVAPGPPAPADTPAALQSPTKRQRTQ